ncbi:SlyX protein [Hydrogenophaga crassostreae]|uniref:SlyX protein n=1 Tax=Hydrogenophaga crassostreae TaxID=1763535 RepID=A0A167HFQ0_9BURK|nr:SlyX family protein [Hydrogenophaga crassostreae]AOW12173.1 SlyX protein [Hydrogenophaga crassostreae]OAD41118.1 SlyX protein [Hydrogenophaga crassostreae]
MSDEATLPQQRTEERLTELEIKLSYTEDLLDTLNTLVANQQQDIAMLLREVGNLRQQGDEPGSAAPRSLRDELPPHY